MKHTHTHTHLHTRDAIDVENECALEKADGEPFESVPGSLPAFRSQHAGEG